jgi:ubiquinone/menaquinone biosynthesis C-methylase UbiE
MNILVKKYCEMPSTIRKPMWQVWHKLLIRFDKDISVHFMNYGYDDPAQIDAIPLKKEDEANRYCIQLYDHVVNKVLLKNKDVLEVGSGRGGGASYIARYYKPKSYTGLDISASIIDFCNRFYNVPGLSFVRGIAENPPFPDQSFDAVVNVESARCYSSLNVFFNEVQRVLREKGMFLFADMMHPNELEPIRKKLNKS